MERSMKKPRKPSVSFSQELFDDIMVEIMMGLTIRKVCSADARPSIDTFYRWLNENSALSEQYTRAREVATDGFEADILEMAAVTDSDNAAANKARFEMLR